MYYHCESKSKSVCLLNNHGFGLCSGPNPCLASVLFILLFLHECHTNLKKSGYHYNKDRHDHTGIYLLQFLA